MPEALLDPLKPRAEARTHQAPTSWSHTYPGGKPAPSKPTQGTTGITEGKSALAPGQ